MSTIIAALRLGFILDLSAAIQRPQNAKGHIFIQNFLYVLAYTDCRE